MHKAFMKASPENKTVSELKVAVEKKIWDGFLQIHLTKLSRVLDRG